jgi:predicted dinucleotide-binding enzyme
MKKIGIIGSGVVGKTLAKGFLQYGYDTTIASRSTEKRLELQAELGNNIHVADFASTAQNADMVVLAVKGTKAKEAMLICGLDNLHGKTIIDATNPIADAAPQNGVLRYFSDINFSLMEDLQTTIPNAHFVKAFSCVGSAFMVNPSFDGQKPSMFICGNNDGAKQDVADILTQFGWDIEDMGKAEAARAIEPLAMLWCIPGMLQGKWSHAFKLLKK